MNYYIIPMTTVNVSDETRVRLTNRKTYELSSVDKVINNVLDRVEGINPVELPASTKVNPHEEPEEDAEQRHRRITEEVTGE